MYKHPIGLLYSVLAVEFCIRIDQYIIINKQNIVPNFEYFRICFSFDLIYEFTYLWICIFVLCPKYDTIIDSDLNIIVYTVAVNLFYRDV